MTSEKFERMEGLVNCIVADKFESSIRSMFLQLEEDGFNATDIQEYLERVVGFVMQDITDSW
jgi:hypothetical protein